MTRPSPPNKMNKPAAEASWPELQRERRAIVVVDMVESVRLIQAHEDDVIGRWRGFVRAVRDEVVPSHRGRLVKSLGDGLLLEFADVHDAVSAAREVQRLMARHNGRAGTTAIELRVGVHVADVVVDELDVYGVGVNLAARLATLAEPAGIVLSADVHDTLVPGLDPGCEDLGECYVKHLPEPVRAYRVVPETTFDAAPAVNPERTMELVPCIAVVPFAASGGNGEATVVADVLADSLITALARRPELRVMSRLSSAALAGRGEVPAEFLRGLGASFALAGSCRLIGGRVLASFELLDLRDAGVFWADQGGATVDELLQPGCELVERVVNDAARAVIQLDAFVAATMPLPTLASHALQWGAVTLMHRSQRAEFDRVREMLEQLIERHGRVAAPRAWLAKWHILRLTRGLVDDPDRTAREAVDLARRAVAADPGCALALAVEGFVHCHLRRDLEAAAACLDQSIAICPNESLAWLFRGVVHAFADEGEAGVRCTERALQLSPIDPLKYYFESLGAAAAVAAGWNARAIELAQQSLRRNVLHTSTYRTLAIAQVMDGRVDKARQTVRRLMALEPGFTVARFLARVPSGERDISQRFARALTEAGAP